MKQYDQILSTAARMIPLACFALATQDLLAEPTVVQYLGLSAEAFVTPAGQKVARWGN